MTCNVVYVITIHKRYLMPVSTTLPYIFQLLWDTMRVSLLFRTRKMHFWDTRWVSRNVSKLCMELLRCVKFSGQLKKALLSRNLAREFFLVACFAIPVNLETFPPSYKQILDINFL